MRRDRSPGRESAWLSSVLVALVASAGLGCDAIASELPSAKPAAGATARTAELAAQRAAELEIGPYRSFLVRGERPPGTATLYRMHTGTGEVCASVYLNQEEPEHRGCAGAVAEPGPVLRFELHAAAGYPGTNRSTAYRIDRFTGAVCRFETAHSPGGPLAAQSCWLNGEQVHGE